MKEILGYPDKDFLGYKYITLCSGGIKLEGEVTKIYLDPINAWDDFRDQLEIFLSKYNKKESTLIWRKKPVLAMLDYGPGCYVISRLVVYPQNIYKILREKHLFFGKNGKLRFNNNTFPSNINDISKEQWEILLKDKKVDERN